MQIQLQETPRECNLDFEELDNIHSNDMGSDIDSKNVKRSARQKRNTVEYSMH